MCCRSRMAVLLIAGLASWSAPAKAVTTDEIRDGLQDWLANAFLQSTAGVAATLDGDVSVTSAGSGFRAVLPSARITLASGRGTQLLIDAITVDLQPLVGGSYAANWILPDTVEMRAPDGAVTTLSISEHSGHGLFAPELGLMVSSELELHGVEAARPGHAPHLAIDTLSFSTRYDATDADLFDQSTDVRINGLAAIRDDGSESLRIGEVTLSGGARNVNITAWRDLRALLGPAGGHRPKSSIGADDPGGSAGDQAPSLLTAVHGRHRIHDAQFGLAQGTVAIGDGTIALSMDGLDTGSSSLAATLRITDLELPQTIGPLTPREIVVDLVLNQLPTDRLFDAMIAMIGGAGLAGSGHGAAMLGLYLQDAMMTSGARIEVREVLLIGDESRLRFAGAVKPTYAAPLGIIADLDMSIGGLEPLVAAARADSPDPETLRQLAVLQAVGTPAYDPDGTPVRRYALEITPQGQILLNGADLMPPLATAAP